MAIRNILLFAAGAAAHFGLTYPEWRADTLTADEASGYDQRVYPCKAPFHSLLPNSKPPKSHQSQRTNTLPEGANVPADEGPTTDWPLTGGSVTLDLHHDWTYLFLNLGLGTNVTNFNITLSPPLWNSTGSGTLCVPRLPLTLPDDVEDGSEASLQVVTVGADGSALYNCANLRLVGEAEEFGGEECETDGVEFYVIGEVADPVTSEGEVPEASGQGEGGEGEGDAEGDDEEGDDSGAVRGLPAASILGLALVFAVGLTL